MTTTLDLSSLTDDGDTLELPDGRTLRLRIIPDDVDPLDLWGDADGAVAPVEWSRDTIYPLPRPDGFTGRAVKVDTYRGGAFWWEPPADVTDPDALRSMRDNLRNVLEYGYCGYVLEVLNGTDAYRRPIVTDVASLWGVEPFPDADYVRTLVSDLASELDL